jgi:hypothetical protein
MSMTAGLQHFRLRAALDAAAITMMDARVRVQTDR